MRISRSASLVVILICALGVLQAESFRVRSITPVSVTSQHSEGSTVELGYNDAIAISLDKPPLFLKGLEVEVKIPRDLSSFRNSMAWGLYRSISPNPAPSIIDYQGEQISLQPLPSRLSFVLQIPLRKGHGLKDSPYSTVITSIQSLNEPLIFRLLPIMKGLPESIETLKFTVRIKPLLADEGAFQLQIHWPEGKEKPVVVRIDEALIDKPSQLLFLAPGTHHLSIVSEDFRNEVRVFSVETARITEMVVELQDTVPRLFVSAPENTHILLDSVPLDLGKKGFPLEPGDHEIIFRVGDYELKRMITAEKGRDYTISMQIDLEVVESP